MDQLSLENLIDLRESTTRRLKDVEEFKPASIEARTEQNRRKASLNYCLDKIEERIKDLQFEAEKLPFDDTDHTPRPASN
jgi:hypothetical protein